MTTIDVSFDKALLLDLIPNEVLEAQLEANKDNPKVVEAITSHLQAKALAIANAAALEAFMTSLNALEVPSVLVDVQNIYRPIINETRLLSKGEVKEVLSSNPSLNEEEVKTRLIETGNRVWGKWVINKAFSTSKSTATSTTKTRKLAITLNARDGSTITPIGNFRTSKEACSHLSLDTAGDSARRVLEAHKYIVDDYEGNDFLIPETAS